ncbi:MAG: hypothetical protein COB90_05935 [Hyphomicrobiales bacterium]|nr:MAG: hypothetical protein COB90_05935 [Hyphomicrobiales bacterium]
MWTVDPFILGAIFVMGLSTLITRLLGPIIISRLSMGPRSLAALDSLPPAILIAVIAPMAFATGIAETLAAAVTLLAATRLPLIVSIICGVGAVVLFRHLLV